MALSLLHGMADDNAQTNTKNHIEDIVQIIPANHLADAEIALPNMNIGIDLRREARGVSDPFAQTQKVGTFRATMQTRGRSKCRICLIDGAGTPGSTPITTFMAPP